MATRIARTSAVLTRAFSAKRAGKAERQVGQERLPCWVHLVKHPRQKLCWQGACRRGKGKREREKREQSV